MVCWGTVCRGAEPMMMSAGLSEHLDEVHSKGKELILML
jgi:hypothetical protein